MKCEEIKFLGSGVFGEVYKVKCGNKYYARKRTKILEEEMKEGIYSPIQRELYFYNWIKQLPSIEQKFFSIPYEINYIKCGKLKKLKKTDRIPSKTFLRRLRSSYCAEIIMDLKDGTLDDLPFLDTSQYYCIIIQISCQ